ncbi:lipocalin-like domain-containing protein [Usitatibacter rugosus]|uniref:lipocalin-like domain-containing protein n=1 Tax=Usitatibacter rugosus TaxID=2732067 RepID=UPI001FE3DF07|nr:lipocalin-like domain-containing protein [Usitatibacter rugosus]
MLVQAFAGTLVLASVSLLAGTLLLTGTAVASDTATYDPVVPGRAIRLPEDAGAHPGHRLEWWYVTGHLDSDEGPLGFQVTFFRARNPDAEGRASRFAPSQLLFAHAALAQPSHGRLRHEERNARAGFGLAEARTGGTDVFIDDWSMKFAEGAYRTRIPGDAFTLDLTMRPTQPPILQGDRGFSRKGPSLEYASYYYSEPHLEVTGTVRVGGKSLPVRGTAWLDHEWSSAPLAKEAVGWDWVGLNFEDGAALMAFRMRGRTGNVVWAGGTYRPARGEPVTLGPDDVRFTPLRSWKSPRTATDYPVAMEVRAGGRTWKLEPLLDDQELDARGSTGTLYWEGAVKVTGSSAGKGYLELTGYREKLPF